MSLISWVALLALVLFALMRALSHWLQRKNDREELRRRALFTRHNV